KNDHSSGAWVIAQKAVRCVEALTNEKSGDESGALVAEIEKVASEILRAQPGMAQLTNLFNAIFMTIEQETSDDPVVLSRKIAGEAKRFDESAKRTATQVAERGAELISTDKIVLTHSNSSTIFEIIKKAHEQGKTFQVIISESRPVCEGRERATELSKLGIQTLYLIDAAIRMGVERADVVLLGADSLSENSLVNKIGSTAICLLAREALVPCYAVCVSSKFTPQKLAPKKEPLREPKQVWDNPPPEIVVENYYFDEVPLDLFTGVITEDGIFTPAEMRGKVQAQKLSAKLLEMVK
ncbi:translation initiation factor eIF-2B, partial [bacterium]|nr:translation initiation factor eIF-2B [bacterium]